MTIIRRTLAFGVVVVTCLACSLLLIPGSSVAADNNTQVVIRQIEYTIAAGGNASSDALVQCLDGETVTGGGFHASPGSGLDFIGSSPLVGASRAGWDVAFENRFSTPTPEATLTVYANCTKGTTSTK